MASCTGAPPAIPDLQEESSSAVPSEAVQQTLANAKERVKRLRKLAEDFEGPHYYPELWNSAESRYTQAEALTPVNEQEYEDAIKTYDALGDTYDEISLQALSRYAETRNQAVQRARERALAAGAQEALPEQMDTADTTAAEAQQHYEAKAYDAFARESVAAEALYNLLETEAAALGLRSEIETQDLSRFDPDTFASAEASMEQAVSAYAGKDIAAAQEAAEAGRAQYESVLATAWEARAREQQQRALALRDEALNLKAPVAMKDAYTQADAVYTEGESAMSIKDFKQALEAFTQAVDQFLIIRDTTAKKRQTAAKAIETAQDKIADSDKRAKSAQAKLGGIR
jgi:hypothetical protein